ncbi:hypothetical protein ACH5RR_027800 [Cinchona calisaya]|uniref:Cation-transporting P-type ATPase C-terminal domain-containing protein n=1 Tax=Cinchona calisaya TaxID=153742 RepID=A0ABD2YNY8_9GENT
MTDQEYDLKPNNSNYPSGSQVSIEIRETTKDDHRVDQDTPNFSVSLERIAEMAIEMNDHQGLLSNDDQSNYRAQQLFSALQTNIDTGIIGDEKDLHCRIKAFGSNKESLESEGQLADNPAVNKSLKQLVLEAFKDSTIVLLLCCATLSLIIDIKMNGPENGFVDGTIIFLAIFIVVNFGNIFRFLKSRIINILLKRLIMQRQKQIPFACVVIRQGKLHNIPVSQVVVGDIVLLETGSQVPADGLFIDGSNSCKLYDGLVQRVAKYSALFSGAKVVEGSCRMLVTSVGENTERSKLMKSLGNERKQKDHQSSNLLNGVDKVNSRLENLWLLLSLIVLTVQLLRCFLSKSGNDEDSNNPDPQGVKNRVEEIVNEATKLMKKKQGGKINGLVGILCVLVFATRDGLPLGIFVLFFLASKKMKFLDTIVENLSACATLGVVTTVFLSKTDDLALNHAEMAELWIGLNCIKDVSKELNSQVLKILQQGVSMMNSSGDQTTGDYSLFYWAHRCLDVHVNEISHVDVDRINGSNSLVVRRTSEETQEIVEMHWRGDPESILSQCSHYYEADGTMQTLDEEKKATFSKIIEEQLASDHNLPCFAFGYRKVIVRQEEKGDGHDDDDDNEKTVIDDPAGNGMILIGFVRLKNPYPPEIRQAAESFREMGVNVKLMVDVDNVNTARIMARHSGLLRPDHDQEDMQVTVIEGKDFRNNSEEARMKMMDKIHVIANASPSDKLLMVQCLRKKAEEVVATTCSCIRDFPSLIGADVGIFLMMGENINSSTIRLAKEDADIVIINNEGLNIAKVADTLRMGRYVCQSIKKFLEFHFTLNISAFIINLIFQVSKNEAPLSSVELLWTNLIVEALGAFALAILVVEVEPISNPQNGQNPARESSRRAPPPPLLYGAGPIITKTMWRNIVVQSLIQVAILMVLGLKGKVIFHVNDDVLKTMIFNSYVLCQVFVMIGGMKMKKTNTTSNNILQLGGFSIDNLWFLFVVGMIVTLQVLLIEIMGVVAHWGKLDCKRWWICIAIAALSFPLDFAAKRVSNFA